MDSTKTSKTTEYLPGEVPGLLAVSFGYAVGGVFVLGTAATIAVCLIRWDARQLGSTVFGGLIAFWMIGGARRAQRARRESRRIR
jgi:hypothetical protein